MLKKKTHRNTFSLDAYWNFFLFTYFSFIFVLDKKKINKRNMNVIGSWHCPTEYQYKFAFFFLSFWDIFSNWNIQKEKNEISWCNKIDPKMKMKIWNEYNDSEFPSFWVFFFSVRFAVRNNWAILSLFLDSSVYFRFFYFFYFFYTFSAQSNSISRTFTATAYIFSLNKWWKTRRNQKNGKKAVSEFPTTTTAAEKNSYDFILYRNAFVDLN